MAKTGEDSNGFHLGKFEKRWPTFSQIYGMSVYMYQNVIYTAGKSFSVVICGHDFANERLLVCQFDV